VNTTTFETDNKNAAAAPKVTIAAGGTGGHLYPGLALAVEFRRSLGAQVTFITTPKPVTLDILRDYDFPYQVLHAQALQGKGWCGRALSLLKIPFSVWQARTVLRQQQPRLVVGMGGYISGPVGLAAHRLGIPLVIHEQNAVLGTTNKLLGRLAATLFLSFSETERNPAPERSVWVGNPIRDEFCSVQEVSRPDSSFTVLIMGGSQGAHHLNMEMLAALPLLQSWRQRLHCIHLTGPADLEEVQCGYQKAGFSAQVLAFSPKVRGFMQQAHLVLCRAGASTLAELTVLGRVGILVPYPYAANQHQEKNAASLSAAGAAFVVLNQELTGGKIAAMIEKLMQHSQERQDMEERSRSLGRPHAAAEIVAICQKYFS
jgi:UDP-N-acetylglucosamine--N-acetylmuramyl-(pentapeptide) pyrophosphoryl-undecaprenol N-acetylglucosamine transferase